MRAHRIFGILVVAAVTASWFGCSSSDTGGSSSSGSGGSGGEGATTATTSTATTATTVSATTGGGTNGNLGSECSDDADCGASGKCLKATEDDPVLGGAPAAGYCSMECVSNDECEGGLCLATEDGVGRCFRSCELGPDLAWLGEDLDPDKCYGREDVRCQVVNSAGDAACLPSCGSDSQCDGSRVCDPRITVCVNDPNTGTAMGSKCDPDATEETCAGNCIGFSDSDDAFCSSYCVLGGAVDSLDCGGLDHGICLYAPQDYGLGDLGFCTAACTQQDDCQNPLFWCFILRGDYEGLVDNGFCFGATECPNGDECADGEACTDTIHGPFCLDPTVPLGSAGTGSGGGGQGGGGQGGDMGAGGMGMGGMGMGGMGMGGMGMGGMGGAGGN
jgi:hypothetical protein